MKDNLDQGKSDQDNRMNMQLVSNQSLKNAYAFLDSETVEKLQFMAPEIVKMVENISGSRNCQDGDISG